MPVILDETHLTVSGNGTHECVPFLALKETILGKRYQLSIAFVSARVAQSLNIAHRGKDYVPNTLSFSLTPTSGEIILCTSAMRKQYRLSEYSYDDYVIYIIIHSMLHLKGMQHGSTMERKEAQLLSRFASPQSNPNETTRHRRH